MEQQQFEEMIKEYIKNNVRISVEHRETSPCYGEAGYHSINVSLMIDGEEISSDGFSISIPND